MVFIVFDFVYLFIFSCFIKLVEVLFDENTKMALRKERKLSEYNDCFGISKSLSKLVRVLMSMGIHLSIWNISAFQIIDISLKFQKYRTVPIFYIPQGDFSFQSSYFPLSRCFKIYIFFLKFPNGSYILSHFTYLQTIN